MLGGINTYGYVGKNPLNRVDSLGLLSDDFDVAEDFLLEVLQDRYGLNVPNNFYVSDFKEMGFQLGSYDVWEDKININEYNWIDEIDYWNDPLSEIDAFQLLDTHIHEVLHLNQNLFMDLNLLLSNVSDWPLGDLLHNWLGDNATDLTWELFEEYNQLRLNSPGYLELQCQ